MVQGCSVGVFRGGVLSPGQIRGVGWGWRKKNAATLSGSGTQADITTY